MRKEELTPTNGRKSFYGKALINTTENGKELYSYNTLVCAIENGRVVLYPKWDYSATTLIHVKAFLERNGFAIGSKKELDKWYAKAE